MGTIKLILTLFAGVVLAALVLASARSFEEGPEMWLKAVAIGAAYVAANLLAPVAPAWLGLLAVILPLGCFAYLFIWWGENGSNGRELMFFIFKGIMLCLTALACTSRVLDITSNWVARGLIMSIPSLVLIALLAFMGSNMISFKQELEAMSSDEYYEGGEEDDDEEE